MNNLGKKIFVFLYRNIADIERNWSVADDSNVSDSQFSSDIVNASTTIPTTTIQNDTGRSENRDVQEMHRQLKIHTTIHYDPAQ